MPTNQPYNVQENSRVRRLSIFVLFAFVIQLVGLAGPGWIVVTVGSSSFHIGMWFAILCVGGTCNAKVNYEPIDSGISKWERYQILTTAGTAVCLVSLVFLLIARKSKGCCKFGTLAVFMPISGACAISASALVGRDLIDATEQLDYSPYDFPWALLLTGVGGVFSIIAMFISIRYSCQSNRGSQRNQTNSVPVTNQAFPQSQSHLHEYTYNAGYSPPAYAPPVHVNETYGATNSSPIYPNLNVYGPNPGSDFVARDQPLTTPSAPPFEML